MIGHPYKCFAECFWYSTAFALSTVTFPQSFSYVLCRMDYMPTARQKSCNVIIYKGRNHVIILCNYRDVLFSPHTNHNYGLWSPTQLLGPVDQQQPLAEMYSKEQKHGLILALLESTLTHCIIQSFFFHKFLKSFFQLSMSNTTGLIQYTLNSTHTDHKINTVVKTCTSNWLAFLHALYNDSP